MNVDQRITILEVNQQNIKQQLAKLDRDLNQIKYILYAMLASYLGFSGADFLKTFF